MLIPFYCWQETLDKNTLQSLINFGRSLGMEPLVESHSADDLKIALMTDAKILGINNRDLSTFAVNLSHGEEQLQHLQRERPNGVFVCESGILAISDIEKMAAVGYKSFLIGEAFMKAKDPAQLLRSMLAVPTVNPPQLLQ